MPPNLTAVAPVKLVPVITTDVPLAPEGGEKEIIVGSDADTRVVVVVDVKAEVDVDVNVKLEVDFPNPFGVVTLIIPLEPRPTMAIIPVGETTVKPWTAVPPKLTAVVPVRLVPVITTDVPLPPEAGKNEIIVGAEADVEVEFDVELKVKLWLELADPLGVVTLITPLAPLPTTAVI